MIVLKPQQIGLITGTAMILTSLLAFYYLNMPLESNFQLIIYGIYTTGIVWSLLAFRKNVDAKTSFKDWFSNGFKMFVVVVLLMAVYAFVFFSYNTAFRDAKIAENSQLLLKQGDHLANEIAANEQQLKKLYLPIMVSSAVFRYLIIGALVTAIGSGLLGQRKTSGNDYNNQQLKKVS